MNSSKPVFVKGLKAKAEMIAVGGAHACAALADGTIACWGDNAHAQHGDGTTSKVLTPTTTATTPKAVLWLAAGVSNTCGVWKQSDSTTALYCWGRFTLFGDTSLTADVTKPRMLFGAATPPSNPVGIAVGAVHACFVQADATVKCAGDNTSYQLGEGGMHDFSGPIAIAGSKGEIPIGAGRFHTCAAAAASPSAIMCWGENDHGQLGNGTTTSAKAPVTVAGVDDATQVTAGFDHTCVLAKDYSVRCWGSNRRGQIGNSGSDPETTPVKVPGLPTSARAVAAGTDFTCALLADDSIWCWGANDWGQLGAGSDLKKIESAIPVKVVAP
jgi:alpha-tubulin suppressor-like RCC1 family protein